MCTVVLICLLLPTPCFSPKGCSQIHSGSMHSWDLSLSASLLLLARKKIKIKFHRCLASASECFLGLKLASESFLVEVFWCSTSKVCGMFHCRVERSRMLDAWWARFTASIPVSMNFGRSTDFELPWLQPGILLCMLCILLWTLGNANETVGMQVWSRCNPEAWNELHLNIVGDLGVFTFATSCAQCSFPWRPEAFMPGFAGVTPLCIWLINTSHFWFHYHFHLCSADGSSHPFNINYKVFLTNGVTKSFGWSAVARWGRFIFAAWPLHGRAERTHLGSEFVDRTEDVNAES